MRRANGTAATAARGASASQRLYEKSQQVSATGAITYYAHEEAASRQCPFVPQLNCKNFSRGAGETEEKSNRPPEFSFKPKTLPVKRHMYTAVAYTQLDPFERLSKPVEQLFPPEEEQFPLNCNKLHEQRFRGRSLSSGRRESPGRAFLGLSQNRNNESNEFRRESASFVRPWTECRPEVNSMLSFALSARALAASPGAA